MKTKLCFMTLLLCGLQFAFAWINEAEGDGRDPANEVLILKVDYTTNIFEGGQILRFPDKPAETLTITYDYRPPGDFGDIKLYYDEIDELLFYGDIIWMGCGEILFPDTWMAPDEFLKNYKSVYLQNGFLNVFPNFEIEITEDVWNSVQCLEILQEFLASNPTQQVQYLFYTPSVGVGNPEDWKWILFLHKPFTTTAVSTTVSSDVEIYPVTQDKLFVKAVNNDWSYRIYDNQGRLLQYGTGKSDIDVSRFKNGIYILNVDNDGKFYSQKFIKK